MIILFVHKNIVYNNTHHREQRSLTTLLFTVNEEIALRGVINKTIIGAIQYTAGHITITIITYIDV